MPDEKTKVQDLLDYVDDCKNPKFCAAVLAISDIGRGMSTDVEKSAALFLPMDPVTKKSNKRKHVVMYEVTGTQSDVGTRGVSLRWH